MRQLPLWPQCYMTACEELAYELAPGLPTLYCANHRASVLLASKVARREQP